MATITSNIVHAICRAATRVSTLAFEVRRVRCQCDGTMKRERLSLLAGNPHYTKRFAWYIGHRGRESTVKDLDKQYMRAQLELFGAPAKKVIGIDEISIAKATRTGSS
ncbi:MAG: hypothetical protein VB125_01405 [Burkholderia sp.]